MSRTRRSLSALLANTLLNAGSILGTFYILPKIVLALGADQFGSFRVLSDFILLPSVLSVALSQFLNLDYNRQIHQSGKLKLRFEFYFLAVLLLIPVLAILTGLAPTVVNSTNLQKSEIWQLCLLASLSYAFLPFLSVQSYLEATQQSYKIHLLLLFQRILLLLLSWYFVFTIGGVRSQFWALILSQGAFFILMWVWSFRQIRNSPISIQFFSEHPKTTLKQKSKEVFEFLKIELAGRLGMAADSLLISYFLGSAFVTPFYLALRIPQLIQGQLMGVGNSVWAALSELWSQKKTEQFVHLSEMIFRQTGTIGIFTAVGLYFYNPPFLKLWISNEYQISPSLNLALALNLVVISMVSFLGWVLVCTGNEKKFANISLSVSILNFLLGCALTPYVGISGPAWSSFACYGLLKLAWLSWDLRKENILHLQGAFWFRCLFFAGLFGIGLVVIHQTLGTPTTAWSFVQQFFISTVIGFPLCWFGAFSQSERSFWTSRLSVLRFFEKIRK